MSQDQIKNAPRIFVHVVEPNGDHRVTAYRDATIERVEHPLAAWNYGYLRDKFTGGQTTFTASNEHLVSEGATADAATMKMLAHLSGRIAQLEEQAKSVKLNTRDEDEARGRDAALNVVLDAIYDTYPDSLYNYYHGEGL